MEVVSVFYKLFSKGGQKLTTLLQKLTIIFIITVNILYASEYKNRVVLGLTGVVLKEDIATIVKLKRYLEKKSHLNIAFKFVKSYAEIKTLLLNESIDFAYICGSTYVDLEPSKKVELLALPTVDAKPFYQSLVVVQRDANYTSLYDLKGKIFAISDPESNSGSLVPKYQIYKKGYDFSNFFKKVVVTYDHGESIEAVRLGFVDGASVDSVVYKAYVTKNPNKAKELKVINSFGEYPIPPFVIREDVKSSIKQELKKAMLSMASDKEGKAILKTLAIDGFIAPNNISYKKIKAIKEYLNQKESPNDR